MSQRGCHLIRRACLIDGTGAAAFEADLLVEQGRIAAIGEDLSADGAAVLDAGGLVCAPGFIDAHCHDDLICLREPDRPEKIAQGVTTAVAGNCGFSLYPAARGRERALAEHFGALLGMTHDDEVFESFPTYRDALEERGLALNLVSLVGHGALRLAVVGLEDRPATAAERAAMEELLAAALADGAAGLSLGLVYPPSAYADTAELAGLARVVASGQKLLTAHVRSYEAGLLLATDEFLAILRTAGARGLLSHLQAAGRPNGGLVPPAIDRLEAARCDGVDVAFDMYPYPAGSSYLLQLLPPEALAGGRSALLARLADPAGRAALRRFVEDGGDDPHRQSKVALIGWDNVRLSAIGTPALKPFEGLSMAAAAEHLAIAPFDLLARLIEEDGGETGIILFQLDEADLRTACTHPLHLACSDALPRPGARPHPRGYGTFPRFAGRLVRAGWFTLEDAVRRMTGAPAAHLGLVGRGILKVGAIADLVLFDRAIDDPATFEDPTRRATGVAHLFVAGEPVLLDGRPTGRRPGRVLRTEAGAGPTIGNSSAPKVRQHPQGARPEP